MNLNNELIKKLQRNIWISQVNAGLMWARFYIPVIALFYIASEVSLTEFTIIMSVFSISILVLEIPSGVLADLLGKKKVVLVSRFLYLVELALVAFMNGFWPFLIAKIISGIAVSLTSGASEALLYDSVKRLGKEEDYKKIVGKQQTIGYISMAFIFIIGAYLFSINTKLPAIISIPFVGLGFILTWFMTEPYINEKKATFKNSLLHMKEGLQYFWKHKYVRFITLFSIPFFMLQNVVPTISSAYFQAISIPISAIGVLAFIAGMVSAFSSKKAHKIEDRLKGKSLYLIVALGFLGALLMGLSFGPYGYLFYLLISFATGLSGIVIGDYINKHINSSHRATMLSIKNMGGNVFIALIYPIFGTITEQSGIHLGIVLVALVFLVGTGLTLFLRK